MRNILIVTILFICFFAKGQDFNSQIYNAYLVGDMDRWENILKRMELNYRMYDNEDLLNEIIEVQYGLIGYLIGADRKSDAEKVLKKAEENLEKLLKNNENNARLWAYKSAFVGFRIGISPYKAPFLGPKSFKYIDQAILFDSQNPYVLMEFANGRYYAPAFAGGDKRTALEKFKQAIYLLEQDSLKMQGRWYYLMAKTKYGNILMEDGNAKEALRIFNEILIFEPNYTWVSKELKPNAIKFME